MTSGSESLEHGYVIIRAVTDDSKGRAARIGVAAWDAPNSWYNIRTIADDERVQGMTPTLRRFGAIVVQQLQRWAEEKRVPYAPGELQPWKSDFWSAASEILSTAIRIDPPKALSPQEDRDAALESLYEAIVQPSQSAVRERRRVDGAVTQALGGYSGFFDRTNVVNAFGGAQERVMRRAAGEHGEVFVEAVNLAGASARKDADALVSRMWRIFQGRARRPRVIVGYLSSPGGLNGETHMREWMRQQVTPDIFDLDSERQRFREVAGESLRAVGVVADPNLNAFE